MICMEWSDDLRTGVEELDGHHRHLIDLLNKAFGASMYHHQKSEFAALLDELIQYAHYHFDAEVKRMEGMNFPGLADHLKEHEFFVKKVGELQQELKCDKLEYSLDLVELTQFLADWLTHHIREIDRQYAL